MATARDHTERFDRTRIREPGTLGRNIRARRLALDYSQSTLADVAGTTNQYISDLECSQNAPSLRVLATLALALGCTLADLFADVPAEELL